MSRSRSRRSRTTGWSVAHGGSRSAAAAPSVAHSIPRCRAATSAVREIASHRLMARAPERVEGLTALLVLADRHLMARARSIFDGIVLGYDDLAERITEEAELGDALAKLRQQVEQELTLALEEVRRITRDGTKRAARGLGAALKEIKRDVLVYGTLDDMERRGRSATDRRKVAGDGAARAEAPRPRSRERGGLCAPRDGARAGRLRVAREGSGRRARPAARERGEGARPRAIRARAHRAR